MLLTVLALVLLAALIVRDFGLSWDEPIQMRGGDQKLQFYQQLLGSEPTQLAASATDVDLYPGLFDLSLALIRHSVVWDPVVVGHFYIFLWGLLCIIGTWKLGCMLGSPLAGLLSMLCLILMPRFFGHLFINPKDIPFAAGFVWSVIAIISVVTRPTLRMRHLVLCGVVIGLTAAVRLAGLSLLLFFAGGLLLRHISNDRS